jgi:hypothetical protein
LFIDEIDALVGARSFGSSGESGGDVVQGRVLASFLTEMDGIGATDGGVVLVGATNRLEVCCHVHSFHLASNTQPPLHLSLFSGELTHFSALTQLFFGQVGLTSRSVRNVCTLTA